MLIFGKIFAIKQSANEGSQFSPTLFTLLLNTVIFSSRTTIKRLILTNTWIYFGTLKDISTQLTSSLAPTNTLSM